MSIQDIKHFYNSNFFNKEGKAINQPVQITIRVNEETLALPSITANANTKVFEFVINAIKHIQNNPELHKTSPFPKGEIVQIETIEYRGKKYRCMLNNLGDYFVKNVETGKDISNKSVVWKGVVKGMREVR